jgi:hypothetical protein
MIRDAGFTPAKRDNRYDILKIHNDEDAPDRMVTDWSALNKDKLLSQNEELETIELTVTA